VNSPDRVHQTRQGPGQHRAAQTFHPQFEDRQKSVAMGGRDQQQRAIDRLQFRIADGSCVSTIDMAVMRRPTGFRS
jgi:hypothetical protein